MAHHPGLNGLVAGLDSVDAVTENYDMEILGRVHNGVVILQDSPGLPEGAVVSVTYPARGVRAPPDQNQRVEFPLVRSAHPGSVQLTNNRVHEALEEEEIEAMKTPRNVPS